jgi:hypothetical protein
MAKLKKEEEIKQQISKFGQRFNRSSETKHKLMATVNILDMFDRGEQWQGAIPPWVPKPVTNYIRFIRTLKRANLASNIGKAHFFPEHADDAELVNNLQEAYDHVWDRKKVGSNVVRKAVDRALLQGTAIAYVYTDDTAVGGKYFGEGDQKNSLFKGDICIKRIPIGNFFPDPDAYCIEECKWVEYTEVVALETIRNTPAFRKYCEEEGTLKKLDALKNDELDRTDDASGDNFDRDYKRTDGGQTIQGDELATLHVHFEKYYKGGKWHVDSTYYLKNTDFYLLRIEDMNVPELPFAVLYDEEEEGTFWGTSTAMDILENQKIVNKLQQTASVLGVMHQNPQKVVWRESGINAKELARTGTLPGKVWTSNVDPTKAVRTVEPMDIPKGLFELDDRTQGNIREITGVNEAYTGQSVGSLTTSSGVDSLIDRATIRDKDKMIQIDEFVERISHLIVLNILHNWQDERPIAKTMPNGTQEFSQFNPVKDKLTRENLSWRVRSNVYASAPMTQASRREQADKLMNMQGQYQFNPPLITTEEYVKMQEFDNGFEIIQRMEADRARMEKEKAQNLAQQISQLAEQLNQMLGTGMPPEQAAQQVQQMAQEMLDKQRQAEQNNGISSQGGGASQQPQPVEAPSGNPNAKAMDAMTQGF